jgi:hypothetical protein
MASGFERNGQTLSRLVLFVMSMPMISGEETVAQAPKWERDSLRPMEILWFGPAYSTQSVSTEPRIMRKGGGL